MATKTTKEQLAIGTTKEQAAREEKLKLEAGAVSSKATKNADGSWTLTTVWNVID